MKVESEKTYEFNPSAQCEMPRYKCHKEVHAIKISGIIPDSQIASAQNRESTGGFWIEPFEEGYSPFYVTPEYAEKHKPQVGGYYVVYADGYSSFSPAKAFEDGYKLAL